MMCLQLASDLTPEVCLYRLVFFFFFDFTLRAHGQPVDSMFCTTVICLK